MPRHFVRLLLAVALIVSALSMASAQNPPASGAATDVPRLQFEKYTLPNGLEVILSQDRRLPMVAVNLWYHVGPANEEPGRTGFAHLFEHMMFQSSKHVPPDSHIRLLEAAGASDLNGTTDFDRTNYFSTVPANQLELALWLESDRMGYLLEKIDQASLSNQQDVVRNERRQNYENQPYGLADEAVVQTLFPKGHPYYGNVIGSHEDIQTVKLDDVSRFFRQYYAPNNATMAIVGDYDPAAVKPLVQKYFGTLRRGPTVPPIKADTPTIASERRKVVTTRAQLPRVYMAWLTSPIYKPGDADADIMATILGGGRSSRLYKKLVYERQIAQNVQAQQYSLTLGSIFQIEVTGRPGRTVDELEKAIDEELAALRAQQPAANEIERARNTIETNIVGGLERLGGFGGVADRLNTYNHYLGNPDYLQKDVERYRAVTPATLLAFVREQLPPTARVVLHAVPGQPQAAAPVPTPAAPVVAQSQGADAINADEPWRLEMPKPGPTRTLQLSTPVSATLPNGLTLILSERRGLPIVAANLVFKTGSGTNPTDKAGLANFMAAMLDEGTATRSALQIADEVAELGASLTTGSTMDATTVSARSLAKNFGASLGILADVALRPAFPVVEIDRQRAQRLGQLVQQRDNPAQVAAQVQAAALYGTRHPYGYSELGTEASVRAMTRDDMLAFYRQNFVPNNAALIVAGDISMTDLRALADRTFGGWQRGAPAQPVLGEPTTTPARIVIVDKPGSPQTQLRVATIGAARSSPDFRPLQVMNMALGGLFSSRINMNLREQKGYSYGTYSQFTFRRSAGPFTVAGGVRTDATAPAVTEIFKEIAGIIEAPMSGEELTKAKDSLANSLPGAFESSADAVSSFSNVFTYTLGLDYYTRYAAQVNAVTATQALDVAKRYLVRSRMVVIAVGDRAAIEPELRKLNLGSIEIRDAEGNPIN
ncbi:MAG: peptidase M16 [Acidobacteria bacterium RIFCSPLOWO2_12_FULL_65_11]|nr:MAG: peptidase M16 [Acidobacteria bacterium RIFCSPLOWO2_12_FULL_65_11]